MTKPLSSTAQAVLDAFSADDYGVYLECYSDKLAAAIRALVEYAIYSDDRPVQEFAEYCLAVADELEKQS